MWALDAAKITLIDSTSSITSHHQTQGRYTHFRTDPLKHPLALNVILRMFWVFAFFVAALTDALIA